MSEPPTDETPEEPDQSVDPLRALQGVAPGELPPEWVRVFTERPDVLLKLQAEMTSGRFQWAGPPPAVLRGYDELVPGSAKQLIDQAMEQGRHRQELERKTVLGASRRATVGQWQAFIIALVVMSFAFVAILYGHEAAGATIGSVDIVGLVSVFIVGSRQQKKAVESPPPPPMTLSEASDADRDGGQAT